MPLPAASRCGSMTVMDAIFDASWRTYPATALMAVGAALVFAAGRAALEAGRLSAWDAGKGLAFMRAFRVAIVGLALLALGGAWAWQLLWLGVLAAVIGGGELFESSLDIAALRRSSSGHGLRPSR